MLESRKSKIICAVVGGLFFMGLISPEKGDQVTTGKQETTTPTRVEESTIAYDNGNIFLIATDMTPYWVKGNFVESLGLIPTANGVVPVNYMQTNNCGLTDIGITYEVHIRMGGSEDYIQGYRTCISDSVVAYEPKYRKDADLILNRVWESEWICTESKAYNDYDCTYPVSWSEWLLPRVKKKLSDKVKGIGTPVGYKN